MIMHETTAIRPSRLMIHLTDHNCIYPPATAFELILMFYSIKHYYFRMCQYQNHVFCRVAGNRPKGALDRHRWFNFLCCSGEDQATSFPAALCQELEIWIVKREVIPGRRFLKHILHIPTANVTIGREALHGRWLDFQLLRGMCWCSFFPL